MKTKSLVGFCLIALAIITASSTLIVRFGTSPGTMVQLQTSHVPTEEDSYFYKYIYPQIIRRDITRMTEDDPGDLSHEWQWQFPWYGRGMVPFG